jgi:DNA-binding PadR family transcriptional regulator
MPTNAYAVLGLISFGESSGYDLKRLANYSIHFFYLSPAPSQVYSELRRLESLGYVTERRVQQETRPDKRLYHITPSGRDELQRWLDESEVFPDVLKSVFLLKLFFGDGTSPEVLIGQLEARFNQMEERLLQYEEIENEIKDRGDWLFPYLTLGYGMAHVRAEIEWIGSAIDLLSEPSAGPLS